MVYVRDLGTGTTKPLPGSDNGYGPEFSPDGGSLAFLAGGTLWVGARGGSLPKRVTPASGAPEGMVWMPDGSIIYATGGYLLLHRVPAAGGTASPVPARFPGAENLRVATPALTPDPDRLLVSFLPSSSDAPRVGLLSLVAGGAPMVVDLDDVGKRRTLPRPGSALAYANWHPSGEEIAVLGNRAGAFHGYLLATSGTGQPRQISALPQSIPLSFFPDGKSILGYVVTPDAGRDLWVFGLEGDDTPLLQTPANERAPVVAPDGRAIAYVSDESGEDRVYVRLYPDVGQAWPVSGDGATAPRWSRDGKEIFFLQNAQIMAISIDRSDGVRVGRPQTLFRAAAYEQDAFGVPMYDVAADGRFLMVRRGIGVRTWRFVQHWSATLGEVTSER